MPGAFGPEGYIDFYENPFEVFDSLESSRGKREPRVSWAVKNLPNVDLVDLDWHKYDPPRALTKASNITSQVILDILQSSLENVQARIIEEDCLQKEIEEQEKQEETEKGKSKEPYLPIIIPTERLDPEKTSLTEPSPKRRKEILMTTCGPSVVNKVDARASKRRLFALRRFFQRSDERGESSATGAALGALRKENTEDEHAREGLSRSTKPSVIEEVECVSCLDDFHPKDVIKVPCHNYCRDCFVRLVAAACQNEQQWPPKCCLNEIPVKTVFRFIPTDLKKTFEERSKEWELPISERVYCSDPNCSLWIKPKRIDPGRRQGICDHSHITCTLCRGPSHAGEDCPQDVDMTLTNQLAECGTQFCYVCSRRWRTCTCTMENLQALKEGAASRRAERRAQELGEAEELRHILRQIEEFEREEALKAELLRLEQERLEEEHRQHELEERVRQESIRRRDIKTKYQELRIVLDNLHDVQQVLLDVDQEEEAETMIVNIRAAKQELEKKHEEEMSELKALSLTKKNEKESALNKEFRIRAAEENDLEEAYYEQLKTYWKDKDGGCQEINDAMLALRACMDQKHDLWQKWKAEQLKTLEAKLEDNRIYREELMYSAKHRLNDSCKEKEADMKRRMAAEKKWLEAVRLEREKLLNKWEVQEVEGDADTIFAVEAEDPVDGHYVIETAF
ncbi:e3 ubiquitin ligase ARI9 [Fusarium beomiforme]|uniref:E3 ubiquitin ligase ARI9 n=1 Tax=Fusarium beomiforme TaxID=44412 RepID=A0A9P5AAC9_9HYPO|nr:e3 ubiquitin ligase ARI9 [Fusarium beomiforme]